MISSVVRENIHSLAIIYSVVLIISLSFRFGLGSSIHRSVNSDRVLAFVIRYLVLVWEIHTIAIIFCLGGSIY